MTKKLALLLGLVGITACHSTRSDCADYASPAPRSAANAGAGASEQAPSTATNGGSALQAVIEANIVQLDDVQDRIYAMSKSGSLAIVDAKVPGTLRLLGKTALPGEPFEMYRRDDVLLTMSNGAVHGDGHLYDTSDTANPPDATASAIIAAIDIGDPAHATTTATLKVAGEIADSRIIGNILYLATYENAACWGCGSVPRTLITSFDITTATAPRQVDQIVFEGKTGAATSSVWSTPWKRSVTATATRLYVGGLSNDPATTTDEGVIDVVDVSDPGGHLARGAHLTVAGPIMSRWQMDESGGYLRVVSQRGAGRLPNGEQYPDVDTFRVESSTSLPRLGHLTMTLPRLEGLKTVRFDGTRAYAVTFEKTDPLITFDLSNPASPSQRGGILMPGWVFDIEPKGDRLIGLGLDRGDMSGNLNLSLFDVSNLDNPAMLSRVSFGPTNMYTDAAITGGVMAEDQDRIQKAIRIFDDGLVTIPFSGGDGGCSGGGGVQLVDWSRTSLTKDALLPVPGNPRRAVRRDSDALKEVIAISDSTVASFTINQRTAVVPTANVTIGTCVIRTVSAPGTNMPMGDDVGRGDMPDDVYHGGRGCY